MNGTGTASASGQLRELVGQLGGGVCQAVVGRDRPPRRFTGFRAFAVPTVGIAVAVLLGLVVYDDAWHHFPQLRHLTLVVCLAQTAPLAFLPRWPLLAWRVAFVAAAGLGPFGDYGGIIWPPILQLVYVIVLFAVGMRYSRTVLVCVWAASLALLWNYSVHTTDQRAGVIMSVAITLVAVMADGARSLRRSRMATAAALARADAERERRALLEERAHIARELHDVVAHHVALIGMQADSMPYRIGGVPEEAREDLAEMGRMAREAMAEMRRVLGVLRNGQPAERAPQPGLAELSQLIDGARRSGLRVEYTVTGQGRPLPASVDLSAYRITQEALTNAARHAPGADTTVTVTYAGAALELAIVNGPPPKTARKPHAEGFGHGLAGMRERVAALGGTLRTGPRAGGFEVHATLPLDRPASPVGRDS